MAEHSCSPNFLIHQPHRSTSMGSSVKCHGKNTILFYSANSWTPSLTSIREAITHETGHPFNSVLANLYRDGNDAMGWHSDDEPCNGPEPVIASVSFGAERRFDFRHRISKEKAAVVLPHGSLLLMSGQSQHCWQHSIARSKKVTSPRINLTFRFVTSST